MSDVVIIGGGAAGCFCAAELARLRPDLGITVLEARNRPMTKLAITGGGRCNLTNTFEGIESLAQAYPRGDKFLRKVFGRFGHEETCRWFEAEGVRLVAQEDHCVFPASQDAMQIVRTLENLMRRGGVQVRSGCKVLSISPQLEVAYSSPVTSAGASSVMSTGAPSVISTGAQRSGEISSFQLRPSAIVLTTGGGTADLLDGTGIELVPPVPSLFTLKIEDPGLRSLMGTVVGNVTLGLAGTRFRSSGSLLLTDWGVSGPATLRLSSYAARWLADNKYRGTLLVNWLNMDESSVRELLPSLGASGRTVANSHPSELTDRLWRLLVAHAGIRSDCRWTELGSKGLARLINVLISDSYSICGRARFKEEFVTCGGVALSEVRPETMESRKVPGLYFAGEVLDIDAVTGGFNLQAAWSTSWLTAHSIAGLNIPDNGPKQREYQDR